MHENLLFGVLKLYLTQALQYKKPHSAPLFANPLKSNMNGRSPKFINTGHSVSIPTVGYNPSSTTSFGHSSKAYPKKVPFLTKKK